jgi:hypothetical protein
MPRRRELKSIASGIASFCVSRNNDIFGYWGVGVIYRLALAQRVATVSMDLGSTQDDSPELAAFRAGFLARFQAARHGLSSFVQGFVVEYRFDPYSWSDVRGQCSMVTCCIHITDDLGKRRSASAETFCYPHDPRFETKSTRVNKAVEVTATSRQIESESCAPPPHL